jgi:hypothetical protein
VSQQQRDALDQLLRDAPLDLGGDVAEQRVISEEMMAAIPVPADVTTSSGSLGGIPVVNVEVAGADPERIIFYLHGGARDRNGRIVRIDPSRPWASGVPRSCRPPLADRRRIQGPQADSGACRALRSHHRRDPTV